MQTAIPPGDDLLHQRGYRNTPQRYMILCVLQESHEHLSIAQILERVQQSNPYVNLATVYRTLELFTEVGLARAVHLSGHQTCYEAVQEQAHHHFVCRSCHGMRHLDPALLGNLHERLEEQYQVYGLTLELVATGFCDACWQTMQQQDVVTNGAVPGATS
jgi:Fe2+ or Zn2+ uptake regulation protein